MDIIHAAVQHKVFGEGTVTAVDGAYVKISFPGVGEKKFPFPAAFGNFLHFREESLQEEITALLGRPKQESPEERPAERPAEEIRVPAGMKYSREKLIREMAEGKQFVFHPFYGHAVSDPVTHNCFSNWYPCTFEADGAVYHTTEQYMMAHKALMFRDREVYEQIMRADDPKEYKALGRQVRNYNTAVWDRYRYGVVLEGCRAKFSQNPAFAEVLLGTGDEVIVEAAPRDLIWGVGYGKASEKIPDPRLWRGRNLLGFVLMEVRDFLRESQPAESEDFGIQG